jgi:hypothetical protein
MFPPIVCKFRPIVCSELVVRKESYSGISRFSGLGMISKSPGITTNLRLERRKSQVLSVKLLRLGL